MFSFTIPLFGGSTADKAVRPEDQDTCKKDGTEVEVGDTNTTPSMLESLLPVTVKDTAVSDSTADQPQQPENNEGLSYFSGWMGETEEDDAWIPSLTRKQRLLAFFGFAFLSAFCFSVSIMLTPFIVFKARKFALLFSTGSLSAILSLSMLRGPSKFWSFMLSKERWMFTVAYMLSLIFTLYCAMGLRRTVPTIFAASCQLAVLGHNVLGYIPGGMTGVRMLAKMWFTLLNNTVVPFLKVCLPRLFS